MATTFPGFLNLSREEANKTLQNYKNDDGKFLIRPSTTSSSYTISVVNGGNIMKYPVHVNQTTQHFYVNQARQFPRMQDLINFYRNESISNNAQVLLREPINGWPRGARGEYGVFVRKNDTTPDEQPSRPGVASKPSTPGMASKPGTPGMASKPNTPGMASKPNTPGMASKPNTTGTHKQESTTPINGQVVVHRDLPRDMVARVFEPFMNKNGSFLIRPSSTSDGKLTLCVSYNGSIVNFKISKDNATNMYRITTKSFSSLEELVTAYRKHPIKSKMKQQEIYLTDAIPVSAYATKVTSPPPTPAEQSVPEPWVRYHDKNTKKFYYYNKETKKTQWDPPVARHLDLGPLPPVPGKDSSHRPKSASLPGGSPSVKRESPYASRPLPALPDQNINQKSPQIKETQPSSQPPTLPMKDTRHSQPPTLPTRETHPAQPPTLPIREIHSSRPPALPTRETHSSQPPALPTRETHPSQPPALPMKETHSSHPPALPTRETHPSQPPALPMKETHSSQPPALPTRESRFQRRTSETSSSRNSMTEKPPALPTKDLPVDRSCPPRLGEQAPPKMQPVKANSVSNDTILSSEPSGRNFGGKKKPPPLPQKEKTPEPSQNRVHSPPQQQMSNGRMSEVPSPPVVVHTPPSPGGGIPPPPPPPPPVAPPPSPLDTSSMSAPVTPTMNRSRTVTANDLANMRGTLKRAQVSEKKTPQMSGIGGALSKALDQRRVYVQESDSECEEAEDDDWDD